MTLIIGWPACQIIRYYCLYYFCYYCQFIIVYNFGVNVTVVIEHIVFFLLTAAGALISVSYVYLRLFFLSLSVFPFSLYYVIMSCMYIIIGCQLWCIFLSGSLPLLYYFRVITTLYLLLANKISDLTAVVEVHVSCRWRRTKLSPGDWRWTPGLMSLQRQVTKTAVSPVWV